MTDQITETIRPFLEPTKSPFKYPERTTAYVLMIGDRYFYSRKNNRLSTACYLGGAKLFGCYDPDVFQKIEKMAVSRGKKFKIARVCLMLYHPI